jgi:hypothetical protein
MKFNESSVIDVSHEVTKADGTNDGIWYFGDRLQIENELIIGFSPTNYHCFVIAGEKEFHPRFSINPCKLQPSRKNNVRAAFFIRVKDVAREDILKFQEYLVAMEGKRTPTCHQGLLQILDRGIGIRIPKQSIFRTTPRSFMRNIFKRGLVDRNGNALTLEVYKTRSKTLKEMYFDISIVRFRYAWVFGLFNIYFKILSVFRPQILVK